MSLNLGDTFYSVSDVFKAISEYENKVGTRYFIRESRRINIPPQKESESGQNESITQRILTNAREKLVYQTITYICRYNVLHKGAKSGSTFRKCPSRIGFQLSADKVSLYISRICERHSHEIDRDAYNDYCMSRQYRSHIQHITKRRTLKKNVEKKGVTPTKSVEEQLSDLIERNRASGSGGAEAMELVMGAEFRSMMDVEVAVGNHEIATHAKYVQIAHSRYVGGIMYDWVIYACNNYGDCPSEQQRAEVVQVRGQIPELYGDKTKESDCAPQMLCTAHLVFRRSARGDTLTLSAAVPQHSHPLSLASFLNISRVFETNRRWNKKQGGNQHTRCVTYPKREPEAEPEDDTEQESADDGEVHIDEEEEEYGVSGDDLQDMTLEEATVVQQVKKEPPLTPAHITAPASAPAPAPAVDPVPDFSEQEEAACGEALLETLIGPENCERWRRLQEGSGRPGNGEFVAWMLDIVERSVVTTILTEGAGDVVAEDITIDDTAPADDVDDDVAAGPDSTTQYQQQLPAGSVGTTSTSTALQQVVHHEEEVNTLANVTYLPQEEGGTDSGQPAASPFTCVDCGTAFLRERSLALHQPRCNLDSLPPMVVCTQCGKLVRRRQLALHNRKHAEVDRYSCKLCRVKFPVTRAAYERHMYQAHGVMGFACRVCGLPKGTSLQLDRHMYRSHGVSQLHAYQCDQCGRPYRSYLALYMHVSTVHSGKLFQCPYCHHETLVFANLKKHVRVVHKVDVRNSSKAELTKRAGDLKLVHTGNGVMKYKPVTAVTAPVATATDPGQEGDAGDDDDNSSDTNY